MTQENIKGITHLITIAVKAEVHAINLTSPNVATAQQWRIYSRTVAVDRACAGDGDVK